MVSQQPKGEDAARGISDAEVATYHEQGYLIVRGLWSAQEVAACRACFGELAARGEAVADRWTPDAGSAEPLKRYPRYMHPHLDIELVKRMLLDRRIHGILGALLGEEPLATQSMYYFKPPGGKGQALHQDNYYLRVKPSSCVAAWTAIDRAHPDNGGLWVCPGTQNYEVQCPVLANPEESFTTHFVRPPAGADPVPAKLEPGDVLFFNGCVVHGSRPNTSSEWRRSLICHYMPASSTHIANYYAVVDFAGQPVTKTHSPGGGPCGELFGDKDFPHDWEEAKRLGYKPVDAGSIPG